MGDRCWTGENSTDGAPATRRVGESGLHELGMGVLEQPQLADQRVVVGVGDLGRVELVVPLVVMRDQRAELLDPPRRDRLRRPKRRPSAEGYPGAMPRWAGRGRGHDPVATAAPTTASGSPAS